MKNFKDYMKNLGYVSLQLKNKDVITSALDDLQIENYHNDFHVTLIYDERNPSLNYLPDDSIYFAQVKGVEVLGEVNSKWRAITLILDSGNSLEKRHNELKNMGFKHSYDCFIPHISLKYNPSVREIETVKDNLDKFKNLILIFGNEKIEKTK